MAKEEKKGLFGKAVDALTNRDEKEAAEAAARAESEAKVKAAAAAREAQKAKEAAAARAVEQAKARAEEAEAKLKALEAEKAKEEQLEVARAEAAEKMKEWQAQQAEAAKPKIIAEHKLTETETLSHLSLKYYGSAIRDYWMVIYEENKEEIGDNPAHVRVGMTIRIPELPEELKKDK